MTQANKRTVLLCVVAAFLVLVLFPAVALAKTVGTPIQPPGLAADLVIKNAKVLTVDKQFSIQQAVAVKNGVICFVGANKQADKWIGPTTRVLDLGGRVIMPGVNESHIHATQFAASLPPLTLDLTDNTVGQALAQVQTRVEELNDTTVWIRGQGWPSWSDEWHSATRQMLDAVAPDNPVILTDMSLHNAVVNSKALALAGITEDTPNPDGGTIIKDPVTGEPTGFLLDLAAVDLVMQVVPLRTDAELHEAVESTLQILNANGVTSFTEGALGPGGNNYQGGTLGARVVDAYKDLYAAGKLTARVSILGLFGNYGGLSFADLKAGMDAFNWNDKAYDKTWLQFPGVKIFADGIPVTYTSWLWQPYVGTTNCGTMTVPGATDQDKYNELVKMIRYVVGQNLQIAIHATGDRAISSVLDGFALAKKDHPSYDHHNYIIHGELITPADARRAAKMDIGVNMQPSIQPLIAGVEPLFIGAERAAYEWPFQTVYSAGAKLMASSDAPVTYPNWRKGVQAEVTRLALDLGGNVFVSGPAERLTREQAIRTYTINGAWQDQMESVKGSIEKGKLADFCILDQDIMTCPATEIGNANVLMTIVGGKVVYDNSLGAFAK
jgi:predicted amidohydrolase YtcJ